VATTDVVRNLDAEHLKGSADIEVVGSGQAADGLEAVEAGTTQGSFPSHSKRNLRDGPGWFRMWRRVPWRDAGVVTFPSNANKEI
jgi:hypothetical protein